MVGDSTTEGAPGRGGATHRDPGSCWGALRLRGCVVGLLGQADVSLQPAGAEPETRVVAMARPPALLPAPRSPVPAESGHSEGGHASHGACHDEHCGGGAW